MREMGTPVAYRQTHPHLKMGVSDLESRIEEKGHRHVEDRTIVNRKRENKSGRRKREDDNPQKRGKNSGEIPEDMNMNLWRSLLWSGFGKMYKTSLSCQ